MKTVLVTVSQMFMLQQFSMVISHCWFCSGGLHDVKGVILLLTTIRFLILGRRPSIRTFLARTKVMVHRLTMNNVKMKNTAKILLLSGHDVPL